VNTGPATIFSTFEIVPFPPCIIEQAKAMKSYGYKTGFTLIEMIIVVAIIALLATMVIGIAARIDSQGKERLMRETFDLLDAALEEFADYGYSYALSSYPDEERGFYDGLDFPIDCNNRTSGELEGELADALGLARGEVRISGGDHEDDYSGSEALYFFLNRVPTCRETLDKIYRPDKGGIVKPLITNKDAKGVSMSIEVGGVDGEVYPLLRVVDPWGRTLRYDYYDENDNDFDDREKSKRTFPLVTSAGRDGIFGNSDDITNRK
jgi:prepilin-type N-terminal cleavage/methylation domain-containing protein